MIKPVTHVIFDMDGLLLDTEPIYEKVFSELVENHGAKLTPEVRIKLLGSSERKSNEICVNDLNLKVSVDDFSKEFRELSHQHLPNVNFMPGAEKLIRHLHACKIPICVATSSGIHSVKIKTQKHQEAFKLFHHITTGDDVKNGKPSPEIFLLAASLFEPKASPENCLVLEDSPNGVQGGISAGMQVVMVPADYISQEQRSKATIVINSLEDFKPEIFGLPPFSRDCTN